ncbi:hypothetical protein NEOLEDRAFT_1170735 [Neolentinus lepideus HHB14362 ss-1]|uniref:DUF7702 domain-containing protein n=1 Tax=Neolentinus lepideus HHB14362 ss-1 TaxID=1314782 RepID=A0A165R7A8_9AGAM|nr:hypothetical protein NEOLEDRAFT_1170735 [Neolentinus lepideus HHB14362 ss-1]
MPADSFNYAKFGGIHSVAAAVIFAIIYIPLAILYIIYSIRRPTYVLIVLALFCTIRVTAFAIRAALAGSTSAGENENLFIAEQILYTTGFFGVLYSAYTLVLDRDQLTGQADVTCGPLDLITRITRNRHLIRLVLVIAIVLGIIGATKTISGTSSSEISTGQTMRRASTYIFLVVTILLVLRTIILTIHQSSTSFDDSMELSASQRPMGNPAFGARHGIYILVVISLLLLVREVFYAATTASTNASHQAKANNETYFYPLAALTEFLAVVMFAVPGLVPSKAELEMQAYSAKV